MKKKKEQEATEMVVGADLVGMMTDLCKECDIKKDLGVAIKALRHTSKKGPSTMPISTTWMSFAS
jgi:hypothetical protein